jgi:undecaprenyl-diphosphatase
MDLVYLIILALVQGITEFLPISSSAHLILAPDVTGQADQGPLIDVMAHLGTLLAVMVYFHRDMKAAVTGKIALLKGRVTEGGRLVLMIAVATPPVLIFGGGLYVTGLADAFRDPRVIAWATLIFALPLWIADHFGRATVKVETLGWRGAFLIGLAQMLALIPGASRSGVTMTAARAVGMGRSDAARFSMLMAVPVIAAFGLLAGVELARGADPGASLTDGVMIAALSFVAALAAIALLMKLVDRIGFLPFVIYRLALAGALFWWAA